MDRTSLPLLGRPRVLAAFAVALVVALVALTVGLLARGDGTSTDTLAGGASPATTPPATSESASPTAPPTSSPSARATTAPETTAGPTRVPSAAPRGPRPASPAPPREPRPASPTPVETPCLADEEFRRGQLSEQLPGAPEVRLSLRQAASSPRLTVTVELIAINTGPEPVVVDVLSGSSDLSLVGGNRTLHDGIENEQTTVPPGDEVVVSSETTPATCDTGVRFGIVGSDPGTVPVPPGSYPLVYSVPTCGVVAKTPSLVDLDPEPPQLPLRDGEPAHHRRPLSSTPTPEPRPNRVRRSHGQSLHCVDPWLRGPPSPPACPVSAGRGPGTEDPSPRRGERPR